VPLGQFWIYIEDTISREKEQSNVRYLSPRTARTYFLYRKILRYTIKSSSAWSHAANGFIINFVCTVVSVASLITTVTHEPLTVSRWGIKCLVSLVILQRVYFHVSLHYVN